MTTTEPAPTSTPVPVSGLLDKNLDEACRDTEAKIARVDTKVSFLLAFDGAILAGLVSLADKPLPLPARIAGASAALVFGVAAVLLLLAVSAHRDAHAVFDKLNPIERDGMGSILRVLLEDVALSTELLALIDQDAPEPQADAPGSGSRRSS